MKYFGWAFLLLFGQAVAGTLNISEFTEIGVIDNRVSQTVAGHTGTSVDVTTGVTSVQSNVFGEDTTVIRIVSNTSVRILIGEDPQATATSIWLPAGVVEYFSVIPGHRLAVIDD